jgi:hypothetical protein
VREATYRQKKKTLLKKKKVYDRLRSLMVFSFVSSFFSFLQRACSSRCGK